MENMYAQFVKKQSIHSVVNMKPLQALQISYVIILFRIKTNNDIKLKVPITREIC